MPQENLITPDTVRRLCWEPPVTADAESISAALAGYGARAWQVELVTPVFAHRLALVRPGSDSLEERRLVTGVLKRILGTLPPPL